MTKVTDFIKESLKKKKITQTELAKSLGEDVRVINQQLNRQQDIKAERFLEVMEHIGYRIDIVDNDGIRKTCSDMIDDIKNGRAKGSKFYIQKEDGFIVGIYAKDNVVELEEFWNKSDCFNWLISHTQ